MNCKKCQFSQAVYLGVYAQSGAIPPLHCVMKNSNIFSELNEGFSHPCEIEYFGFRWDGFFLLKMWRVHIGNGNAICKYVASTSNYNYICFLLCIPPYSWFHDVLTQNMRKWSRFQQTLLMRLILQMSALSVCKTGDAPFDEPHFHKMTSKYLSAYIIPLWSKIKDNFGKENYVVKYVWHRDNSSMWK